MEEMLAVEVKEILKKMQDKGKGEGGKKKNSSV